MSEADKLAFEREKFGYYKTRDEEALFLISLANKRQREFELLKIAVIIIVLIVLLYFISSRFGMFKSGQEGFSPYMTTALNDIYRDDPAFDHNNEIRLERTVDRLNNKQYINRENFLYDNLHTLSASYA